MDFPIYDTSTLLGVMREITAPNTFWLDTFFQQQINSENEYIEFEQVYNNRKMAPLVMPTAQGRPIYSEASEYTRVKPAYVKPRDSVEAARQIKRHPGQLATTDQMSPGERWQLKVADILREHQESIVRRWEWLAARAVIDGGVILKDDAYPERWIDFRRNDDLTITLDDDEQWSSDDANPIQTINRVKAAQRRAHFGNPGNTLIMGPDAVGAFLDNKHVREELDTRYRGTAADLNRGVRAETSEIEYLGTIGPNTAVYSYSDYYETEDGDIQEFLDPRDAVLVGDVGGVRAFGAIQDKRASMAALEIFPKMWDVEDPSSTQILTQSAPLMVPTRPNGSARIRVVS